MPWIRSPLEDLLFVALGLLIYLLALSVGRWLKRQRGARLGFFYQLFCVALAVYVPMLLSGAELEFGWLRPERELRAALILLGAIFVVSMLNCFLWESYFQRRRRVEVPKFLRDIAAILVVVFAVLFVLGAVYEQTIPGLLAGSGIIAIILGFALQDLLGNVFSGIALQIGKPFVPGDWLKVEQSYGQVIDVNWRSVRLKTNDDITLDIPNNQIVRNTIVNLTYPSRHHAMRLMVGIEYGVPPNTVKDVFVQAARNTPGVLENPPPKAYLKEFGDSAIGYQLKFYMEDHVHYNAAIDSIHTNIWYGLKRAGISIPFPIRTIKIDRKKEQHDPRADAITALRNFPLLAGLTEDDLQGLVQNARDDHYGRRERIIEEGAAGDSMFILMRGSAEVFVETHSGGQAQVATLRAGDCFGETSLLTGEQRSATVVAVSDCEVLEIGKEPFSRLVERKPELLQELGDILAQRRLENEGVLASSATDTDTMDRRKRYAAGFFTKLRSYFDL